MCSQAYCYLEQWKVIAPSMRLRTNIFWQKWIWTRSDCTCTLGLSPCAEVVNRELWVSALAFLWLTSCRWSGGVIASCGVQQPLSDDHLQNRTQTYTKTNTQAHKDTHYNTHKKKQQKPRAVPGKTLADAAGIEHSAKRCKSRSLNREIVFFEEHNSLFLLNFINKFV